VPQEHEAVMLNPDHAEAAAPWPAIQTAIDVAEAAGDLPAVPTIDWCDRAAACLTRLARSAVALVIVGSIDEGGRLVAHEAVGVAAGQSGPERARGIARSHPRLVQEVGGDEALADAVRARAGRLPSIGWAPDWSSWPGAALLSTVPAGRNWRAGPVGRVWGEPTPTDLLMGLTRLGDFEPGRVMLAQVAPTGSSVLDAEAPAILKALLPLLVRRALQAIGPLRSHPGQWLTTREQAVLERLALGKSVKQIADEIDRSPHTVHDHVKSLHRKLNATSRGELIARALGHLSSAPVVRPIARPPIIRPLSMPA
jgi:DNA-binding CsgD family transcriptional regulator